MPYSSQIPIALITHLVSILDKKMDRYDDVAKLFIIQYSYFELINGEWILKNFLDIGDETISEVNLDINDDRLNTRFTVYAQNPKYPELQITRLMDMRNKSTPDKIYACDLYIDFKPEHYIGKCYTSSLIVAQSS